MTDDDHLWWQSEFASPMSGRKHEKHGEKKMEKKEVRKVEKAVEKRIVQPPHVARPAHQNDRSGARPGPPSTMSAAREYVYAILEPWDAYERGVRPTVADGNTVTAYRFATKTLCNASAVANAHTSTYDLWVAASPIEAGHLRVAATINAGTGIPATFTTYTPPGYASWATAFSDIRCVAMGLVVRDATQVQTVNGTAAMGRASSTQAFSTTWSTLATAGDFVVRGLNKPGDMGMIAWRPRWDLAPATTGRWRDIDFHPPGCAEDGNNTTLLSWSQGTTGVAQSFEIECYAFWEARPLASTQGLYNVTMKSASHSEATDLLMRAYQRTPEFAQERVVATDDGEIDSIKQDLSTVFGSGKSLWNAGKSLVSTVSGLFGSLFGRHAWISRVVRQLDDEELRLLARFLNSTCVRDELVAMLDAAEQALLEGGGEFPAASVFTPPRARILPAPRFSLTGPRVTPPMRIVAAGEDDFVPVSAPRVAAPSSRDYSRERV